MSTQPKKEWEEVLREVVMKYARNTEDAGDMLKDIQVEVLASRDEALVQEIKNLTEKCDGTKDWHDYYCDALGDVLVLIKNRDVQDNPLTH